MTSRVKRFRGGLVGKAHRLLYHSTLGWRVIKKRKKKDAIVAMGSPASPFPVSVEAPPISLCPYGIAYRMA
jgi:hypothetical protein